MELNLYTTRNKNSNWYIPFLFFKLDYFSLLSIVIFAAILGIYSKFLSYLNIANLYCSFMQRGNYSIDFPHRNHVYPQNMFRVKLLCQIIDFSNNYELLHFQFDRWLYKTVSVKIHTDGYFIVIEQQLIKTKHSFVTIAFQNSVLCKYFHCFLNENFFSVTFEKFEIVFCID